MKENMEKFLEVVEANEELNAKLEEIEKQGTQEAVAQVISLAAEYGCTLTEEDFAAPESGELSDDDLEDVSGGMMLKTLVYRNRLYSGGSSSPSSGKAKASTMEYRTTTTTKGKDKKSGTTYLVC